MLEEISKRAISDSQLAAMLQTAREYSEIYLLARQRQKGCDGFGEMTNLKEEFRDVVDKVIQYSQEKKYITKDISYDIDSIADEIVKGQNSQ